VEQGASTLLPTDIDIWRAANILIKSHGEDAALVAAQRADELLAEGDVEGERVNCGEDSLVEC
jgi:hypothetical protein